ncbi:MAG: radical SAM protein [Desulfobacterales bacterium]|nr:radical SAM protein [Desulfobacterales bacterium]
MSTLNIKNLVSGGVIVNYHCVSRCGHCLYNCGPHRARGYLDGVRAEQIFRRIVVLGCRSVHIGGGEPLLDPAGLAAVLHAARQTGMGIDYVETNSAWYVDQARAVRILSDLRAEGLRTLLVSMSPFHNAHIPFARVRGVIDACREAGIQVFPWVNAFVRDLDRLGANETHTMAEFEAAFGQDYLARIPDRYWIHLGGRALETFRAVYAGHSAAEVLAESPRSCARALSDTSHFHIDLEGRYIPGLCAGLAFAMEDLDGPLPAGKYPLLERLTSNGIRGFYNLACDVYGFEPVRESYLSRCDLCTDIRSYLVRRSDVALRELAPRGFYAA